MALSRGSTFAKNLSACLLLASVVGVCFLQLLRHPDDLLAGRHDGGRNDITTALLAYRLAIDKPIREFKQPPFWNPYGLTGIPWHSNPQSALFYPCNWLFLLFEGSRLISWLLVAHHWLAGIGTYFLCRRYRFSWPSALFGGAAFAAAPYLVAQSVEGHYNQVCLVAWFPWALLCFERLRTGQPAAVPLLACSISLCFFCGHAQEVYYLVLALTGFLLVDIVAGLRARVDIPAVTPVDNAVADDEKATDSPAIPPCHEHLVPPSRLLVNWIGMGALTVGLVAIDLLPVGIYTTHAVRSGGLGAEEAGKISLGATNLRQLVQPFALGDMSSYSGPGRFYWETIFHFGIVVSLLAVIGACFGRRRYPVARMVVLFLIAAVFAFGADTPFFTFCYRYIPGISFFRSPSRSIFFCALAVSVMSAAGVEYLMSAAARLNLSENTRLTWFPRASAVALTVASTLELAIYSNSLQATIPNHSFHRRNEIADYFEKNVTDGRVFALQDHLSDFEAWTRGIRKVQGYEPVPLKRYGLFTAAMVRPHEPGIEMAGFATAGLQHYRKPLLDLLAVKYAVVPSTLESPPDGWKAVKQGRIPQLFTLRGRSAQTIPYTIYENVDPLPRAFIIGRARILHPADDVVEVLGQLDPRQELLLDRDLLGNGDRAQLSPARILESTPNRIRVQAELSAPGYLVLTDAWYAGWSATVDGRAAPIVPANFAFRAVPLERGHHEVVFTFSPPLLKVGLCISGFTAMLIVVGLAAAVCADDVGAETDGPAAGRRRAGSRLTEQCDHP